MKGIVKYNKQLYKRSNKKDFKEGDLILFIPNAHKSPKYISYKGIYLVGKCKTIKINYKNNINLCLKIGYNISQDICIKLILKNCKKQ